MTSRKAQSARSPQSAGKLKRLLGRPVGRVLLAFCLTSFTLWGCLTLGGEALEGETQAFDEWALLRMRNPADLSDPIGSRVFEEAMRDVTALGGFTVLTLITVVAVISLWRLARRREAMILAVTVLGAQLSSDLLKALYARPRPALVPHESYVYSNSFPSGHSAVSAAVYMMLAIILIPALRSAGSRAAVCTLAAVLVVVIGISRTYLGVHWPTDVIAGWALGSAWTIIGWLALNLTVSKSAEPIS
ncbi:phosphatase PAP2 family protein [Brevundimonas nasdae]